MKGIFTIIAILVLFAGPANAQNTSLSVDSLIRAEQYLLQLSDSMNNGVLEKNRKFALASFNPYMLDLLKNPATFNYKFESLKFISRLSSPDQKVRIYTWSYRSYDDGKYDYYGILQSKTGENDEMKTTGLKNFIQPSDTVIMNELQPHEWYGALYYSLIEKKYKKKTSYFLLGWQGNDNLTTRKVIDVLLFDAWNKPVFGAPVFVSEKGAKQYRIIFEYDANAVMTLRYEKKKKMIVFDHLSPANPSMKGEFRYYGPDFTYDGLKFRKGIWEYKKNLDIRNPASR